MKKTISSTLQSLGSNPEQSGYSRLDGDHADKEYERDRQARERQEIARLYEENNKRMKQLAEYAEKRNKE